MTSRRRLRPPGLRPPSPTPAGASGGGGVPPASGGCLRGRGAAETASVCRQLGSDQKRPYRSDNRVVLPSTQIFAPKNPPPHTHTEDRGFLGTGQLRESAR